MACPRSSEPERFEVAGASHPSLPLIFFGMNSNFEAGPVLLQPERKNAPQSSGPNLAALKSGVLD